MPFSDISTAIRELKDGNMIILVDDENRENEGDLVIAAEKITAEKINFMAKHGRGLICLATAPQLTDRLNLPLMSNSNLSAFHTNFTVSIDARYGITTGISAADRAKTILTAIADETRPEDLVCPGHIFPLRACKNGVFSRIGHTEGSVDLSKLANLKPAAVICEIMNDNGTMARLPDLIQFAKIHHLKIFTIKDLINYRLSNDKPLIRQVAITKLPTEFGGEFKVIAYEDNLNEFVHLALIKGNIHSQKPILVRIHSECLTGDVFGSLRCDCGQQLKKAMQKIKQENCGVIIYLRQEGRGIGLSNKLRAYQLQDEGLDTIEANHKLGFPADLRNYHIGAQILSDLNIKKIRLLTNNPEKIEAMGDHIIVERIPLEIASGPENKLYLQTKKKRFGHLLNLN